MRLDAGTRKTSSKAKAKTKAVNKGAITQSSRVSETHYWVL
jgi:hypothetical protein